MPFNGLIKPVGATVLAGHCGKNPIHSAPGLYRSLGTLTLIAGPE